MRYVVDAGNSYMEICDDLAEAEKFAASQRCYWHGIRVGGVQSKNAENVAVFAMVPIASCDDHIDVKGLRYFDTGRGVVGVERSVTDPMMALTPASALRLAQWLIAWYGEQS